MEFTSEEFDIELSQIHRFENWHFNKEGYKLKKDICEEIISKLESIYVETTKPFINKNEPGKSSYWKSKFAEWRNGANQDNPFYCDLIFRRDQFYSFYNFLHVKLGSQNFPLWFALKLRQFDKGLFEVDRFLEYHLEKEYKNELIKFIDFLNRVIRQHSEDLFSPRLTVTIEEWLNMQDVKSDTKKTEQKTKQRKSPKTIDGNFLSFQLAKSNPVLRKYFDGRTSAWTELKEELVRTRFIDGNNTAQQLKAVFQNINIPKDSRIIWIGSNIELKWFLEYLIKQKGIVEDPKNDIWFIATRCFVKKDRSEYSIEQLSKASGNNLKQQNILYQSLDKCFA